MKKNILTRSILIAGVAFLFLFSNTASAYWVWTPGTKKFINPKNAVKDTPKEQFEWAMSFYNAKDYQRAATEFEKLTKQYEYSEYASRAQYHVGLCYENMNKFYIAYQNYQKAIDNFPHIENMDEIVAREFNIANMFVTKESPKVLGADILTSLDRAIEIYKKVVENAPYGKLADEAQYRMGLALKKGDRFDEAIQAFQKILDDYPTSTFVDKSKFEVADCANKASLKPAYDAEPTARAIKAFEDFSRENRDRDLSKEADKTIQRLKDRAAEKSLLVAQFYEKQGRYQAAIIYYKDIIETYPESSFVDMARSKIANLTERSQRPKSKFIKLNFARPDKPKEVGQEADNRSVDKSKSGAMKLWNPFTSKKKAQSNEAVSETPKKAKGWTPLSFDKPAKSKEVVQERVDKPKSSGMKLWNPFTSKKTAQPKEVVSETPKAKAWKPLSFDKPAEAKEAAPKVVKESTDKPKSGGMKLWNPFTSKKTAQPKEVVSETPKTKAWKPLSFDKPAQSKEVVSETPKAKTAWKPLSFDKPAETKEAAPKAAKEATDKSSKASGMKLWNPFTSKKTAQPKEVVSETPKAKAAWAPLNFNKSKKQPDKVVIAEKAADAPVVAPLATESAAPAVSSDAVTSEPKVDEPQTPEIRESVAIPDDGSEKPSEIKVTTNEAEVKVAQPGPDIVSEQNQSENPDDQIEKSEY